MADQKKKIFVVDDDPMFCSMLSDHLEDQGTYEVVTFGTGEACLERLGEHPDAIILDYYLDNTVPGAKNGLEILKQIHKVAPNQKVVMLSSQEHYGVALQTIASGAVSYVIKDLKSFEEIDGQLADL
ncbi:MAG: response regulator [Saprospiraceae bacterium]|jgi:two-component system OmpR family response regulator|nr:response regulator [Saprospiraceae bacterium]